MVKMKFTDNQRALEYALYMMAASRFDRTVCRTGLTEKNMLVQYKEQKRGDQYRLEEICEEYLTKRAESLPKAVFHQSMDAYLVRKDQGGPTEIIFRNDRFVVKFLCRYAKNKPEFDCRVNYLIRKRAS